MHAFRHGFLVLRCRRKEPNHCPAIHTDIDAQARGIVDNDRAQEALAAHYNGASVAAED